MDTNFNYMVVDDDPTNNLICRLMIKKFDPVAEIKLFSKPEEGLNFIENYVGDPIVLFLDVNMPTLTGWEFLDHFIKFRSDIKDKFEIYILTSAIQNFRKEKEIYPFVKDILSKPLKERYLMEIKKSIGK
ncbi:MAG: response regulator [Gelidibacter sp.]